MTRSISKAKAPAAKAKKPATKRVAVTAPPKRRGRPPRPVTGDPYVDLNRYTIAVLLPAPIYLAVSAKFRASNTSICKEVSEFLRRHGEDALKNGIAIKSGRSKASKGKTGS